MVPGYTLIPSSSTQRSLPTLKKEAKRRKDKALAVIMVAVVSQNPKLPGNLY